MRKILRQYKDIIGDFLWLIRKTFKYNASIKTHSDMEKMQYTILRQNHVIEKGLSMKTPKRGFGIRKVESLIDELIIYKNLYGNIDVEFLEYPISTIKEYIKYTQNTSDENLDTIIRKFKDLESGLTDLKYKEAGVEKVFSKDINEQAKSDFKSLLYSRHSIRYFKSQIPDKDILNKALILASRTPSACNRQGWKTYIFTGEKCHKLLKWQGGARGFEESINCSILVTANLRAFLEYEIYQAYIDGGLYAMNLINALHYYGLGTIPLSCGFHHKKLEELRSFDIPENDVPIVIIGCGYLEDEFKIAISERRPVDKTNKYMDD